MLNRYKLVIAYNGENFKGFQFQSGEKTVSSELLLGIRKIFKDVFSFSAAGRTDSGVHAQGQVIHFDSLKDISEYKAKYSLNAVLNKNIRVLSFQKVDFLFHSRKAKSRVYYYLFSPCEDISFYMKNYITYINFLPNEKFFSDFSNLVLGYHNFVNFRKKGSNEKSTFCTIFHFSINKKQIKSLYQSCEAYYYEVQIVAESFLYRMVRNLVGSFFEVISNRQSFSSFRDFFLGNRFDFKYHSAQAKGLCLVKVNY